MTVREIFDTINEEENVGLSRHVHIVSKTPSIFHSNLFDIYQETYGLHSVVFSIENDEIGKMFNVIVKEVDLRRDICYKQGTQSVYKLNKEDLTIKEIDTTKDLYLHVMLPRCMTNSNITLLNKLMKICIPLRITLILYHPTSVRENNFRQLNSSSYWTVYPDEGKIVNKGK